mmetsp:Transcript_26195/g.33966  ORF Transcript_26195/g.33966 Transcript_26195/m.33966 type:complete len:98 (-) Transcript_26195:913-1206(-)
MVISEPRSCYTNPEQNSVKESMRTEYYRQHQILRSHKEDQDEINEKKCPRIKRLGHFSPIFWSLAAGTHFIYKWIGRHEGGISPVAFVDLSCFCCFQ